MTKPRPMDEQRNEENSAGYCCQVPTQITEAHNLKVVGSLAIMLEVY